MKKFMLQYLFMNNPRVAIFEDNTMQISMLLSTFEIENVGAKVIATAKTLDEAEKVIQESEEDIDVAVVDGNLDSEDVNCADGMRIVNLLRAMRPDTKIVWHSTFPATILDVEIDFDSTKNAFDVADYIRSA